MKEKWQRGYIHLKKFLKRIFKVLERPEMMILPGQLAFFFVLSVVPIITLIGYGASFFHLPFDFLSNFVEKAFSKEVLELITPMIGGTNMDASLAIFLIVAFFFASNGSASIIVTSNTIYGIQNSSYIKRRIKAIIMTFILVVLFLFILVFPVFGNSIIDLIKYVDLNRNVTAKIALVIKCLKGPFTWFITFIFIKIIYTMAPEKKISSSSVNFGALFTTIFWGLSTIIYSYYVSHIANYKAFYAGLSNIVILMLWVYILAIIFVWGMALNSNDNNAKLEKNV